MSPVCPTQGLTTDVATHFDLQASQRSGSFFGGHGLKAVWGCRRGAAAHSFFPFSSVCSRVVLESVKLILRYHPVPVLAVRSS